MHPYATDSKERESVLFYIAVLSIFSSWILHNLLNIAPLAIPWWIDAPSVTGFYGLFYAIFYKYTWKWLMLRKFGIVKVPNLNGTWKGYVVSSFDEPSKKYEATLVILQNWTQISIILKTHDSKSTSLIAGILIDNPEGTVLTYEYLNEPLPLTNEGMHIHKGTATLTLNDGKVLEGEYYTGRDRKHFGYLRFESE